MELIVIGAGPSYTDRRGAAGASYLVRAGDAARGVSAGAARGASAGAAGGASAGEALLLDLGQGAFPNLVSTIDPSRLTAIVVSHLHPDHFIDLVPLHHYLRYEFDPPRRVSVLGPTGLADRLDALNGHTGFAAVALDADRLAQGVVRLGPFEVDARLVTHTEESYAIRVCVADSSGPGLVYSGDCGRADDLVPLIRPGDTLLCEASLGGEQVPAGLQHLNAAGAARAAAAGHAARLLLTHIQMGRSRADALAAAQSVFAGSVQLVTEGDRLEV